MENIKLENGQILNRLFGKYEPNMVFISSTEIEEINYEYAVDKNDFNCNLDANQIGIVKGQYRKNKKGSNIFDLSKKGHVLIRARWGGVYSRTSGMGDVDASTDGVLYYHRASSNGGGSGYTYIVVPEDWRHSIDIDDI